MSESWGLVLPPIGGDDTQGRPSSKISAWDQKRPGAPLTGLHMDLQLPDFSPTGTRRAADHGRDRQSMSVFSGTELSGCKL